MKCYLLINEANYVSSCPETGSPLSGTPTPGPTKPGGLVDVLTADQGPFDTSALGMCGITMKSGLYWVGFICAADIIVEVHMAAVQATAPS